MSIKDLAAALRDIPMGQIPSAKEDEILKLVGECWHEFEGSADSKMEFSKVERDGGPANFTWKQPILSFTIERHGSFVLGSKRAEKQQWSLNIIEGTAQHGVVGFRQMQPKAPALDVKAIATIVCEEVQKGPAKDSDLVSQGVLIWKGHNEITIRHGKLIPADGFNQTVSGRRKRFRADLRAKMKEIGWEIITEGQSLHYRRK